MENINLNPFEKFRKNGALLTAGNKDHFNSMTIGWGTMGTLWNKDVIFVFVRPERYTSEFLLNNEYFTVSFYEEKYNDALLIMGRNSGRNTDKVKLSKLTPKFLSDDKITFFEANETYILKKIYTQQMNKEEFPEEALKFYGEDGKPHYIFVGEIIEKI